MELEDSKWFIEKDKEIQIGRVENLTFTEEDNNSPIFNHDKYTLIYQYTIENGRIIHTNIKVKHEP